MEIAERHLRYKCSDSIHILLSIARNLSGIFVNHHKACWFRDSNLASSSLDAQRSVALTRISTQSWLYKTPSAVTSVPCRHTFHISTCESTLGQGVFIFFAVPAVSQAAKPAGSVGQGKPSGCELCAAALGCAGGTRDFSLVGTSGWSTEMGSKTSVKLSKVGYCHLVYVKEKTCAHIDFQQERWSAFPALCWPSLFPRHCKELFKLSLCYTHGEFFPHKPSSVTQHSLDKLVSLWFGWTMLMCI